MTGADARTELDRARIRAEAATALNVARCQYVELFMAHLEPRLRIATDTGAVIVVDDDGAPRAGITVAHAARELRAEFERTDPGFYFR